MGKVCAVFLVAAVAVFTTSTISLAANLYWDDNGVHVLDGSSVENPVIGSLYLDDGVVNTPGTQGSLEAGGYVEGTVYVQNSSSFTMDGGETLFGLSSFGTATIDMVSGLVGGSLVVRENSTATMSGGTVTYNLYAQGSSTLTYSGGSVGYDLRAYEDGTLYLDGSGFTVFSDDYPLGVALSNGDELFTYSTFVYVSGAGSGSNNYYGGSVTGTMADGTIIDLQFKIYHSGLYDDGSPTANIVIVPEPMTMSLLAIGGIALMLTSRRRRL